MMRSPRARRRRLLPFEMQDEAMITAEPNEKLNAIDLHLDDAGIESLIAQLESLKTQDSHIHFMTPAWGGKELGEAPHG